MNISALEFEISASHGFTSTPRIIQVSRAGYQDVFDVDTEVITS